MSIKNRTSASTDYNESIECYLNFLMDNFLTQVVESPTQRNIITFNLLICNYLLYFRSGVGRQLAHAGKILSFKNFCAPQF